MLMSFNIPNQMFLSFNRDDILRTRNRTINSTTSFAKIYDFTMPASQGIASFPVKFVQQKSSKTVATVKIFKKKQPGKSRILINMMRTYHLSALQLLAVFDQKEAPDGHSRRNHQEVSDHLRSPLLHFGTVLPGSAVEIDASLKVLRPEHGVCFETGKRRQGGKLHPSLEVEGESNGLLYIHSLPFHHFLIVRMQRGHFELRHALLQILLSSHDHPRSEVDDPVRTSAQQIVPNAGDGLRAGKDMREPGENPRYNEHQQFHLSEALENLAELGISGEEQLQNQLTDRPAHRADVLRQKIPKIGLSGSLHHVVPGVVAEKNDEYRCDVVETLNVSEVGIFGEEAIEDLEHVALLLLAEWHREYRWNLVILSKIFIFPRARSASFCSCS